MLKIKNLYNRPVEVFYNHSQVSFLMLPLDFSPYKKRECIGSKAYTPGDKNAKKK